MYTGHRRTLAKVLNIILIGLTDQGKDWGNKTVQIDCSFEIGSRRSGTTPLLSLNAGVKI